MTYEVDMDTNNGHISFKGKADPADLLAADDKPTFTLSREKMTELFDKK